MKESSYASCILQSFILFSIEEMQTDNTLILIGNDFARKEEAVI